MTGKDQTIDRPIQDLQAADEFRRSLMPQVDFKTPDGAPLWHGWAVFDAFLAGLDHARGADKRTGIDK
jgi:hypothetical protein